MASVPADLPSNEERFADLVKENRQTRNLHKSRGRGIEATACAIREVALLDAYRALTGKRWKDTADG
jgi:hypothetical protein